MTEIKVGKRKLMASGASIVLTAPKEWTDENNLKAGDEVIMVMNGSLNFMLPTEENMKKIRNHLVHATRPDEDETGEAGQSPITSDGYKKRAIASS